MTTPMPADWTPHAGGEMPVPGETTVGVRFRSGRVYVFRASQLRWSHLKSKIRRNYDDIIAYRIIEGPIMTDNPMPDAEGALRQAYLLGLPNAMLKRDTLRALIAAAQPRADEAQPDDALGAVAESLYDLEHTGRLCEHPDAVPGARAMAKEFLDWLGRRGFVVVAQPGGDASRSVFYARDSYAAEAFVEEPTALARPAAGLDAATAWQELVEKDDRNSPEEYPEMALITFDELTEFMARALQENTDAE